MNSVQFKDFYTVPNLNFDISRLRSDLDIVLKKRNFNSLQMFNELDEFMGWTYHFDKLKNYFKKLNKEEKNEILKKLYHENRTKYDER